MFATDDEVNFLPHLRYFSEKGDEIPWVVLKIETPTIIKAAGVSSKGG